ncbi:hypothetical protein FGW37_25810 [Streptomyces rectiverticillatus]|uniref:hypothetical protein n=1 Tax=Streptomyces rectiverticillatus TaxID=173860 RepID=UPI0015C38AC5|nr:hypothetical protein [Streptomyces rectiverticillatus]QLE74558.1 hypothetical protein FGW37_25810 [Streptomyces rectiverticillatus]
MTRVVLVHGIAQQLKGPETVAGAWLPALNDGLAISGSKTLPRDDVSVAFYGDLFRRPGHRGLGEPPLDASDMESGLEHELLLSWWQAAAGAEAGVPGPDAPARVRTPRVIQRALHALSHSSFFARLSEGAMIGSARQVRRYFTEAGIRHAAEERLTRAVTVETTTIVAHSLGSVVAYETLCAHPHWQDLTLITLGSPLAVRGLVFDRLHPVPHGGTARWPLPVKRWINIADHGDAVALVKELAPRFGSRIQDLTVDNGAHVHDVRPYLTARETGLVLAEALA